MLLNGHTLFRKLYKYKYEQTLIPSDSQEMQ